jgi:hypothetical protein
MESKMTRRTIEYIRQNYLHYYAAGATAGGLLAIAALLWFPKYESESLITVSHGVMENVVAVLSSPEYLEKALSKLRSPGGSIAPQDIEKVLKQIQVKSIRDDLLSITAFTREPDSASVVINELAIFLVANSEALGLWKNRGQYIYLAALKDKANACLATHQTSKKLLVELKPILLTQLRIMGGVRADLMITMPGTNKEPALQWTADAMLLAAKLPPFQSSAKALSSDQLLEINQFLYCEQLLSRVSDRLDIERKIAASEFRQLTRPSPRPRLDNMWSVRLFLGSIAAGLFFAWAVIAVVRFVKRELSS